MRNYTPIMIIECKKNRGNQRRTLRNARVYICGGTVSVIVKSTIAKSNNVYPPHTNIILNANPEHKMDAGWFIFVYILL